MDVPDLLDTNILVHAVRADKTWENIKAARDPLLSEMRPAVSIVSHGEALSLASQWNWGSEKRERMSYFLGYFKRLDISDDAILRAYAEIDTYTRVYSRLGSMGKNDLWIAATACATGATLITTDRDFEHLSGVFLNRILLA